MKSNFWTRMVCVALGMGIELQRAEPWSYPYNHANRGDWVIQKADGTVDQRSLSLRGECKGAG